jgi:hypothetical protein
MLLIRQLINAKLILLAHPVSHSLQPQMVVFVVIKTHILMEQLAFLAFYQTFGIQLV